MNCEIISVGTELLLGDISNTDTRYLSKKLAEIGVSVCYHTSVGDDVDRLKDVLVCAIERSEVIIITGGLGSTGNDITCATVCDCFNLPMCKSAEVEAKIVEHFKSMGIAMPESYLKQAMVPKGAKIFDNPIGTAPGIEVTDGRQHIIMLPGRFDELSAVFEQEVAPFLAELSGEVIVSHCVNVSGLSESAVAAKLGYLTDSENPTVLTYSDKDDVRISVTAHAVTALDAEAFITPVIERISEILSDNIYGRDCQDLQTVVVDRLRKNNLKISAAESCTGGLFTKLITDVPGSSDIFEQGVTTYSNSAKSKMLGVSAQTLEEYGAVSPEVASAMALGARNIAGSDLGVGITGIAGPSGGTDEKPVGLVELALTDGKQIWQETYRGNAAAGREAVRFGAARAALNMVNSYTKALPEVMPGGVAVADADIELDTPASSDPNKKEPLSKRFAEWLLPVKGDGAAYTTIKLVRAVALVVLIVSSIYLADYYIDQFKNNGVIDQIHGLVSEEEGTVPADDLDLPDGAELPEGILAKYAGLYAVNHDVVGYIKIDDSQVDNAVLKTVDNSYYLSHDIYRGSTNSGSLFMDYRCSITPGSTSKNLIIYGHNMNAGTMFGELNKFKRDANFMVNHATFRFDTIYEEAQWKIVSVFITNTLESQGALFPYRTVDFADDASFMEWVKQVQRRSLYNTGVDVREDDTMLTLSTCTYEITDARLVIVARKVRPGEDPAVDPNQITSNPSPVFPDAYCQKYGVTNPTFPEDMTSTVAGEATSTTIAEPEPDLNFGGAVPTEAQTQAAPPATTINRWTRITTTKPVPTTTAPPATEAPTEPALPTAEAT